MSGVRRRSPRPGRGYIVPLLLILALLALGGACLLLRPDPPAPPLPAGAQPQTLSSREESELERIEIRNPYDAPYALIRTDDGWQMEGDAGFVFRPATLDALVRNAALVAAEDTLGDLPDASDETLAAFGLGADAVRVAVRFRDGGSLAFRVGDSVPQETPARYFLLEGDSHLYTVGDDVYEAYTYTRLGLHDVRDPALKGELIDRIAFTGENPFTLERRVDGWMLTAPFAYPLADEAVNSLLKKLEGVRFAQYLGQAEETDLPALGLDPPRREVRLLVAESVLTGYDDSGQPVAETALPAYTLTLALGGSENEILLNCLYRGEAVQATVFSAGFLLTQDYMPLLLHQPFNAPTNDLCRLVWEQNGQETVFDIALQERVLPNNAFETDENGHILYDVTVQRDGSAVDSDAFLTAYQHLISLRAADPLPDGWRVPDAAPRLRVTVTRGASAREVAFYPLDPLHDAVAIDGVALFRTETGWEKAVAWPSE